MRKLKFVLIVTIMALTFLPHGNSVNAATASSVTATIMDAYYTDADGGGVPNDVVVIIHFAIQGGGTLNGLTYTVDLALPSGKTYVGYVLIVTNMAQVTATNFFYNTATESGWYSTSVHATLNGDPNISDSDHMIFDPPGGDNSDSSGFGVRVN
ncbi:MAG: hypothetical protein D6732_16225 [Methanobacteriota archaeon]|nr:MAG: hypothetical protein D6732_16225 [Euryarchaeota archaeon]